MEDLTGKRLGQYHIEGKIGQGAMAAVFKAYQHSLDRYVAIKVMPPLLAAKDPVFATRFQREAKAIARLQHPNILPVYDFGVDGDYSYIVMRYVAGVQTMREIVSWPLNRPPDFELIIQVANALGYAHKNGVIHRDVKPSNILIDDGWALLSDFGIAIGNAIGTRVTGTGKSIGTPAYMSPEQARGNRVDHRTDIYALGLILYEMLTKTLPHDAETPLSILLKRTTEPPPLPRNLNPAIPERVEKVIMHALAPNPEDRFDKAEHFAVALKAAITEQPYHPPNTAITNNGATSILLTNPLAIQAEDVALPNVNDKPQSGIPKYVWMIGAVIGLILMFLIPWGGNFFNTSIAQPTIETAEPLSVLAPALTKTPTSRVSPKTTLTSVSTTNTPLPSPSPSPFPTVTPTTQPPTAVILVVTATSSPTPTQEPSTTPGLPTATPSPAPTATPSLSAETFTLLNLLSLDEPTYGLTSFEWEWREAVPTDFGFEVRVWLDGEPIVSVHDALLDNQEGRIEQVGENNYRLVTDITHAAGIRERSGVYMWAVALVRVNPEYADIGIQAQPAQLRFEAPGAPGDDNSSGGEDGGGIE